MAMPRRCRLDAGHYAEGFNRKNLPMIWFAASFSRVLRWLEIVISEA